MNIQIEKFYYSESKSACEARQKELWKQLHREKDILQGLSEEEKKERGQKAISDMANGIMPLTEKCMIFDSRKYDLFVTLAKFSVQIAHELTANVLVYTEDMTGWIVFVGASLHCEDREKSQIVKMILAADGMHISASVDTGKGSPLDVDDAVQLTFWFDFYTIATDEEV